MRIRLDPWPIDTFEGQLTLKPFAGLVFDVETDRWEAIPTLGIPESVREVLVVDGKPRMEARLLMDDDSGELHLAAFGAYVVGAVSLCPHGTRQAELLDVRARRVLAYSSDAPLEPARLSPRNPHTGVLDYEPYAFSGRQVEGPRAAVQKLMLQAEQKLSRQLASPIALEEGEADALPESLVLQDGPVRLGGGGSAVVGYVKTLHTDYLGADRIGLLSSLKCGERTPILRFRVGDRGGTFSEAEGREQRFTWYVRLCDAPFYQHPLAGIMRLEMHAPEDSSFVPAAVQQSADLSGALLSKLGSKLHKDSRAPQNLIPTAALEQAMNRSMGNLELVTRRIRTHLVTQGVVA